MKNKILVTGSSGFIGSNLCLELCKRNHQVFGISRTLPKFKHKNYTHEFFELGKPYNIFKKIKPDFIYHFAADPIVKNYNPSITNANIIATHNILDAMERLNIKVKIIFASSATIYGPHSTARSVRGSTYPYDSVYALTKKMAEDLILWYSNNYKIGKCLILRYCAHVGPNSTYGVVHDILSKLKSNNSNLELIGDAPGSRKPYIHIDDSVNTTIHLAENSEGICNVSPNDNISIQELACIIMDEIGIQKPIKWMGETQNWPGDQRFVLLESLCKNIRPSAQAIRDYVKSIK